MVEKKVRVFQRYLLRRCEVDALNVDNKPVMRGFHHHHHHHIFNEKLSKRNSVYTGKM